MNSPYIRLTEESIPKPFNCGEKDLNEFFLCDSIKYLQQLLAVTYYLETEEETILYFTLSNDKLSAIEVQKSFWRQVKKKFHHKKHRKDYPAVKIGRFAVGENFQKSGEHWGSHTLDFIKKWMISENKTGCRFITVDAYKSTVPFYLKNGFCFMGEEESKRYKKDMNNPESEGTYAMYFDLAQLIV